MRLLWGFFPVTLFEGMAILWSKHIKTNKQQQQKQKKKKQRNTGTISLLYVPGLIFQIPSYPFL